MLSCELLGQAPFKTIYLHGLVRDGDGQKMSKTKGNIQYIYGYICSLYLYLGNVIDPLDTIKSIGCDALRFSLIVGTSPGNDVSVSKEKLEVNR
jgi:valyl-tRNA synthetase